MNPAALERHAKSSQLLGRRMQLKAFAPSYALRTRDMPLSGILPTIFMVICLNKISWLLHHRALTSRRHFLFALVFLVFFNRLFEQQISCNVKDDYAFRVHKSGGGHATFLLELLKCLEAKRWRVE